jgi:DNA-directed RNA polymerase specialized sigma54-like protein
LSKVTMRHKMSELRFEQTQSLQMRAELRQILRIEQADLLELPENDFQRLIAEIERSPLFQRLHQRERLISYQRLPRTDISSAFYELEDGTVADEGSLDIDSLLEGRAEVLEQIEELGRDNFERYFLFPERGMAVEEIAAACDLEPAAVGKINEFINDFGVMSEFYHPSTLASGSRRYSKVASIEKAQEGFIICFLSPSLARGRYSIDYRRFEELRSSGALTEMEAKEARQLFRKLELINNRKATLCLVLEGIVRKQALYLESGDRRSLLPFSQKELARKIGVAPSSVSRAITGKSLGTPWCSEMPLKDFFPRPKVFRGALLKQLIDGDGCATDEAIRVKLWEKCGVAISRRSVTNLRRDLGIPAGLSKRHSNNMVNITLENKDTVPVR